jgi:transcriptional regulator with XRE-family HTH domain
LARVLKGRRVFADISRARLASEVGVSPVTIWRWEGLMVVPGQPAIAAWAKGLNKLTGWGR